MHSSIGAAMVPFDAGKAAPEQMQVTLCGQGGGELSVLFGLIAVLLGALAKPISATTHIVEDAYPKEALSQHKTGLTRADAFVMSDATVKRCSVRTSSGSSLLDSRACAIIMRRFRFTVARDEAGVPVPGIARVTVNWSITDSQYVYRVPDDFTLPVDHLPTLSGPARMQARIMTFADGKVESCAVDTGSGNDALDRLACTAALSTVFDPELDSEGLPVRAMRPLSVSFTSGSTQPHQSR